MAVGSRLIGCTADVFYIESEAPMDPINPYAPPSSIPPLVSRLVADDSGLTIDFELTMDDIVAWSQTLHRTNRTTRSGMRAVWMMFGLAAMLILLIAMISRPIN